MINPDQIRSLMTNDKIVFEGVERNLDDITSDEHVMEVFLKAVDTLYEELSPQELKDFSEVLKEKISQFSLSHDYLEVASHANETVYKITLVQRRLLAEENSEVEAKSVSPEEATRDHDFAYHDLVKANEILDFLKTSPSFEEFYAYCQSHYPSFQEDVLLCSDIFKKFPLDLKLITDEFVFEAAQRLAFSSIPVDESVVRTINSFPHASIKNFLIISLFKPELNYAILDKKNCFFLISCHALTLDPAIKAKVKEFSEFHYQALKDGKIVLEFLKLAKLLFESVNIEDDKKGIFFASCLDTSPIDPLLKKTTKSAIKVDQFSKSLKKAKVMTASIMLLGKEDLRSISEKSAEEISSGLVGPLFHKLGVDKSLEHNVIEHFCASRYPMGLFQYTAPMEDELIIPACKEFIEQVATDRFTEYRHEHNSHKQYLSKDQLAEWEKGGVIRIASGEYLIDSENWQDLFLCGTEVQGSCQAVNGDADLNKCLMGYCLDGKCRIICIKKGPDMPIEGRAMFRIVLDVDDKPCLYLDDSYPYEQHVLINEFAKQRAREIGLPLYVYGRDTLLFSKGCTAPYEYSDAAGGVKVGPYDFKGSLAT